ncbi:hypothetical protein V5T82_01920 [Magnetovibrio sp. PR-2]|uniref:hypothetical protein n=1 Tax=Magnetovibrio sp. PR-2 TaxID=3120356 RepID=UPI002FCDEA97
MTWLLILITVESASPVAMTGGDYPSMFECFDAREYVMDHDHVQRPAQAVCVQTQNGEAVIVTHKEYRPR